MRILYNSPHFSILAKKITLRQEPYICGTTLSPFSPVSNTISCTKKHEIDKLTEAVDDEYRLVQNVLFVTSTMAKITSKSFFKLSEFFEEGDKTLILDCARFKQTYMNAK